MKLVDEIIELLSSKESDLSTALLKTKVLLHKLGEKKSLEWVTGELQGYSNIDSLPKYRILHVNVLGNASNGGYRFTGQNLPLMHLDKKLRDKLDTTYLTQGIAVIEEYAEGDNLQITIAPEFYPSLSKGLGNNYEIESAWGKHSAGAMTQVITEVTSRLLDFVLELSEKLPEELDSKEMKVIAKEIGVSDLFNNTVIGDNATIVVGDSNTQHIKNSVTTNDFSSLQNILQENGMEQEDIDELQKSIEHDKDSQEIKDNKFGGNVTNWIGKMVSKAASSAWDIKIGAAGSLLATAISKYYGF
ncbi:hypothetical protein MNBD_GAMMA08-479 [hydrothermal vent metagenome]|uniref:AbiTii domain-containing protein n=1 Tax=hydrothermal vent metagenome TaxID=652676 RepID=A0A3B0WT33_9ZZZZ